MPKKIVGGGRFAGRCKLRYGEKREEGQGLTGGGRVVGG